ncbi:MAG: hypothetical protein AAF202_05050 [Pseudomonadota bacterium]
MRVFVLSLLIFCLAGCGVKGDPLPPEDAPKLGRGTPTYSRAVDDLDVDKQQIEKDPTEEEEEQNEEL